MIVVAAGSSRRFGDDKLWTQVAGRPLLAHTLDAVAPHVGQCIVVARSEKMDDVSRLRPGVRVVSGGRTRTQSEMAGIDAVDDAIDLIGIHDGARPLASPGLIESWFGAAEQHGGAVPVLAEGPPLVRRDTHRVADDVVRAQTPQVFRSDELRMAYELARRDQFDGLDTAEVVVRYAGCDVKAVPGEGSNLKLTYPVDLEAVRSALEGASRT